MMSKKSIHAFGVPLMLAGAVPGIAMAEPAGVPQLVGQAKYWQAKGRGDLARAAWNRVLTVDPQNREARGALAGGGAPAKAVAPVKVAQPRPAPASTPAPAPIPVALAKPRAPVDRSGLARAAGFEALNAGRLDLAATRFRSALSANPSDADALGGLGIVRLRGERFGEARDLLVRASSLGSPAKWAEALDAARFYAGMDAARAALAAGKVDQAEQLATTLSRSSFTDRKAASALLADIYEQQGRHAEAADLYRQTGGGANALRNQAKAALDSGDEAGAERLLRDGLASAPNDPWIAYDLAGLLNRQGRPAEADSLVRTLALSDDPQPLYAAALILNQSGRTADAAAVMARIAPGRRTQEMRDFATGLDALATIQQAKGLAARGAQAQAVATLRRAADSGALSAERLGALAQAMLDIGDTTGAAQLARRGFDARATEAGGYDSVVRVLAATGQDDLAARAVEKASALAGSSLSSQRGVATLNATLAVSQAERMRQGGQFAAAFDTLQGAWNAAPGNVDILTALGRLYQSGGMNGQAMQTFRMALAEKPGDKGVLVGLIDTATAAGDLRTARETTAQALRTHPEDHEVYLAASRMEQARGDYSQAVKYLKTARTLYMQKTGGAGGLGGGNPFAGMGVGAGMGGAPVAGDTNPFRAAPVREEPANPFTLGTKAPPQRYRPTAYAAPMPGMQVAQDYATAPEATYGDPVLASIDRDIASATTDSGPRVDVDTGYRSRSGEAGLSRLSEISGSAKFSTDFAHGRMGVTARPVSIDAGRPTGSGLARFGTNATPEAEAIVAKLPSALTQAETQHASGVALSASYESDLVKLEAGSTPLGFAKTHVTGHAEITPRLSAHSKARLWVGREAVTDSIVAYAGTVDPRTGLFWGAVMKSGGGASLSYDKDGNGVYADAAYRHYDGTALRDNQGIEVNVGGYLRAWRGTDAGLSVGFNANYQSYDNNQNYFTYGHGGYFSPQSFVSVNFPVRYWMKKGPLSVDASVAPGYQSYSQQAEALYPTETGAQAVLDYLKSQNSDVRSHYDSASRTGFGLSASGSAWYTVTPGTRIGGDLAFNSFGPYKEFRSSVGIRQQIGGK